MGFLVHKKYTVLLKSVFAILYVSLLGSQLSIKFYLRANSPVGQIRVERRVIAERSLAVNHLASVLKHRKHASFSLDKRYQYKHFFAVLSPKFHGSSAISEDKVQTLLREGPGIDTYFVNNPHRGPPAV